MSSIPAWHYPYISSHHVTCCCFTAGRTNTVMLRNPGLQQHLAWLCTQGWAGLLIAQYSKLGHRHMPPRWRRRNPVLSVKRYGSTTSRSICTPLCCLLGSQPPRTRSWHSEAPPIQTPDSAVDGQQTSSPLALAAAAAVTLRTMP